MGDPWSEAFGSPAAPMPMANQPYAMQQQMQPPPQEMQAPLPGPGEPGYTAPNRIIAAVMGGEVPDGLSDPWGAYQ